MKFQNSQIGFFSESPSALYFFGNRDSNLLSVAQAFPNLKLSAIKQVHGIHIVETLDLLDLPTADGQWTRRKSVGLCIQTADCMPIFLTHEDEPFALALHCGWRGVADQIVPAGLRKVTELGLKLDRLRIAIGPHILQNSFQVDTDVRNRLIAACSNTNSSELFYERNGKSFVDLSAILNQQLRDSSVDMNKVSWLKWDTKSDPRFHSFRRDGASSGRQVSFVALK